MHALTDPISGQPDLKGTKVRVSKVSVEWHGLLLARDSSTVIPNGICWSIAPIANGFAFDMMGSVPLDQVIDSERTLRDLLRVSSHAELVSYSDPKRAVFRYAGLRDGRLEACLFFAPPAAELPARAQAAGFLGREIAAEHRLSLLAGFASDGEARHDNIICACFSVGAETISSAIRAKKLCTAGDIGRALRAGTNCGSCIPELKKLLAAEAGQLSAVG